MKRYGNIYKNICNIENIKLAHKNARKDKSMYSAVRKTDKHLEYRLNNIQNLLITHKYKVSQYKTSLIEDKGKRRILYKLPYYPDRIIQWAILLQIEDIFMEVFEPFTCASIKKRGIHYASKMLSEYMAKDPEGTKYCLKFDIKKFYPSIDRDTLKKLLRKKFKDKELLELLDKIIDSYEKANISKLNISPEEKTIYCRPGKGLPVGSYLSQYLANYYLAYFDHYLKEQLKCKYVIRYMDDVIILSDSKEFLHNCFDKIKEYLEKELLLEIKSNYQIFPTAVRGIDFVGYRHFYGYKLLRKKTAKRCKDVMIGLEKRINEGKEINTSQWCSYVSYVGWLSWCNGYNFFMKHCANSMITINSYYRRKVKGKKKRRNTVINIRRYTRISKQHHIKYSYVSSHNKLHKKGRMSI